VLGVDNSEGMIAYARHLEEKEPLGVEYLVKDAADLGDVGTFDCVVGTYLLHYAPTRESLFAMCAHIRKVLRPGGRFVTICMNPDINISDPSYYLNYGFQVSGGERDGAPLTLEIVLPGMETKLSAFRWSRETYEAALKHAGFDGLVWHPPKLDPMGIEIFGEEFWTAYLATPHAAVLSARPGAS
jgi:SAM-dependent methyltransferase